jgi:DNA-binding NtrC family response regulator
MGKKILYVDDEQINLLLFEANLKGKFEIITAESGNDALEVIANNKNIDVVISDMKMPFMNGVEFIKKAKSELPKAGYYILTGYGMTDEIKDALDKGLILKKFDKPFEICEIINEIEK